jgi:peptidoglycan hydrolase CwlO-like protein
MYSKILFIISVFSIISFVGCAEYGYEGTSAEEWADQYFSCEDTLYDYENILEDYKNALEEANENIEELNSIIDDAQSNIGGNYEELSEALEDLYLLDTIAEP